MCKPKCLYTIYLLNKFVERKRVFRKIKECVGDILAKHLKVEMGSKYFFLSYLVGKNTDEKEISDKHYKVNQCFENFLEFGNFQLYLSYYKSKDQHDIKRFMKNMYALHKEPILPIVSSDQFFDLVRVLSENILDGYVIDFRAVKGYEQVYDKYTGDNGEYLLQKMTILKEKGYDIYRLGFRIERDVKYYYEIIRKGLLVYTRFTTTYHLEDQLDILSEILSHVCYNYYKTLPFIKNVSQMNYQWIEGIQPIYDTVTLHLNKALNKVISNQIFEELKEYFGVIRGETISGSLYLNWHLYNKYDFDSTIIVTTPNIDDQKSVAIIPTSDKSKKDALKIYQILNAYLGVENVEIA